MVLNTSLFSAVSLAIVWVLLNGCSVSGRHTPVLAEVDGDTITEADLRYSLDVAHRRERLSSSGALDIRGYIAKLVDERIVIQEARRMGLDRTPAVRTNVEAYIVRESVVRLRAEEILQKISVSPAEVQDLYRQNYERVTLALMSSESEQGAQAFAEEPAQDGDPAESAKRHPGVQTAEMTLTLREMTSQLRDAVLRLKPGERTGVLPIQNHFTVARVLARAEADPEGLQKHAVPLEKAIRARKEQLRSDEYLAFLRSRATISIDQDLVDLIREGAPKEEQERWAGDGRPVARVFASTLLVRDFTASLKPPFTAEAKQGLLRSWIDIKVVDHEALARRYLDRADMREMVKQYEGQLLLSSFIQNAVYPKISLSDENLKGCFEDHKQRFIRPALFRVQQISFKTREEADAARESLVNGADFTWLIRRTAERSGEEAEAAPRWQSTSELPPFIREAMDGLAPGEPSAVTAHDGVFTVFRVAGTLPEKAADFADVKEAVRRLCIEDQIRKLLRDNVEVLKSDALIRIDEAAVRSLEAKLAAKKAP